MNKIICLIDNNTKDPSLATEHGLSIYFEENEHRWLYDTGASSLFINNAEHLGIDIAQIDTLVLSHGHKDHTGGLQAFLEKNKKANIFMASAIKNYHYYSLRHEKKRDITIDHSLLTKASRFHYLDNDCWLTPNVAAIFCSTHKYAPPKANIFLEVSNQDGYRKDLFEHELSLALPTPKGLIILSACSHNGSLNIIQSCQNFTKEQRIHTFYGGMHLIDGFETNNDISLLVNEFNTIAGHSTLITGHCTGDEAKQTLEKLLGIRYHTFHSGFSMEF